MVGESGSRLTQVPVRIPDLDWQQFRAAHGRGAAAAIRGFIAWSLHRPGAAEPSRPGQGADPDVRALIGDEVLGQFAAWYLHQPGAELPRRPGGETSLKMIKIPAGDWSAFRDVHGGKASEAIKQFVLWSLHRPGAQLPVRPPAIPG